MLVTASRRAAQVMLTRYDAKNPAALQRLVAEGAQLRQFSEDLLRRAREASRQLLVDEAAKDTAYRKVFEAWDRFRAESFSWFGKNELAYGSFAFAE